MKIVKHNIGLKKKIRSNKKANYGYINIKGFSIITTLIMSIRITEKEYINFLFMFLLSFMYLNLRLFYFYYSCSILLY